VTHGYQKALHARILSYFAFPLSCLLKHTQKLQMPLTSANPELLRIIRRKERLVVLNKMDLADASSSQVDGTLLIVPDFGWLTHMLTHMPQPFCSFCITSGSAKSFRSV
jgi:hypothetical protein